MPRILLIIGSASCALQDMNAAREMLSAFKFTVMAIGVDSLVYHRQRIRYVTTFHSGDIPQIKQLAPWATIVGHRQHPQVNIVVPFKGASGSSSLLGVVAARQLGYEKIIMAGCPLQGKNPAGRDYHVQYNRGWISRRAEIAPYVRSLSGWTKELLGEPTIDWLNT